MPGVNEVVKAIRMNASPIEILLQLKMKPSRLQQILRCKRFRERIEMDGLLAKAIVHYRATTNAGWAMTALADLTVSKKEESIRKSCMAILNHAVSGKLLPKDQEKKNDSAGCEVRSAK